MGKIANTKSNILIINKMQFGYQTSSFKYCEYLNEKFSIIYLCFDHRKPKISMKNVKVNYVPYKINRIISGIFFMVISVLKIFSFKGLIFVVYFKGCALLKIMFPLKKMFLDIRTMAVTGNINIRNKYNNRIASTAGLFDHITLISDEIRLKLSIPYIKSSIIPLGSDIISSSTKSFSNLHLLYIGTLNNRQIIKSLIGFNLFYTKYLNSLTLSYDIVGEGNEQRILNSYIIENNLSPVVKLHGLIPHNELKPFLEKCNIGISFIPVTDYYDYQPPTKTFEYVLSGLYCIATATKANKEIISDKNGILINDDAESFFLALEKIYANREKINGDGIRTTLLNYTWENIINNNLLPVLKEFNNK
jgi:hypothetical protein